MVLQCSYSYDLLADANESHSGSRASPNFLSYSNDSQRNYNEIFPSNPLKRKQNFEGKSPLSSLEHKPTGTSSLSTAQTKPYKKQSTKNSSNAKMSRSVHQKAVTVKKKKIALTLEWLEENYKLCDGVCLARCVLYNHYLDFCEQNQLEPACAATFGKTIRQKFPRVTTRRLGTRGHSKYHYYGIGIRETSVYYNSVYAGKGLTRFSPTLKLEEKIGRVGKSNSIKDAFQGFLSEVPDATQFASEFDCGVSRQEVQNFIVHYKYFCEQILSAARNCDFEAISSHILHCWHDLPYQSYSIMLNDIVVVDIISLCDALLHEALIDTLLPMPCDELSERHLLEVGNLGKQWENWSRSSVSSCPGILVGKKVFMAQQFSQSITRQISFINLSRIFRSIYNPALYQRMTSLFEKVDFQRIGPNSFYTNTEHDDKEYTTNNEILRDFKDLLKKHPSVEMIVEWLDAIVGAKVIKPSKQNGRCFKKRAQEFLLKWSFFFTRIMHNFTIDHEGTFNSFHYLRMLMDEYTLLAIETQFYNEKLQEIRNIVVKHARQNKAACSTNAMHAVVSADDLTANFSKSDQNEENDGIIRPSSLQSDWEPGSWYREAEGESDWYNYSQIHLPKDSGISSNLNHQQECMYFRTPSASESVGLSMGFNSKSESEAYVIENGTTFTNLTGPSSIKPQTFNSSYQPESMESYTPEYYEVFPTPMSLLTPGFSPTTGNIKPNADSLSAIAISQHEIAMTKLQTTPRNNQEFPDFQNAASVTSLTNLSHAPLTSSNQENFSGCTRKDTYDVENVCSLSDPISSQSGFPRSGVHDGNYLIENKNQCLNYNGTLVPQKAYAMPSGFGSQQVVTALSNKSFPSNFYDVPLSFPSTNAASTSFETLRNAYPNSNAGHALWLTPTTNSASEVNLQQYERFEPFSIISQKDENLPSISSVLNAD